MNVSETVRRRRRGGINRDTKTATETFIRRRHTTLRDVNLERLDDGEQAELVGLIQKATADITSGHNFGRLTRKESGRYERLVEKSAALPPGQFRQDRDAVAIRDKAVTLARRIAMPSRPRSGGEAGLFELLGRDLAEGTLWAEHVLVLAVVLAQLLRAEPLAPQARIEGEGENVTLVADRRYGVLGVDHDPEAELLARWIEPLEHLSVNDLLDVDRDGAEYRIKIGSRTRRALWGQP
jgi:hypothetical protein